MRYIYSIITEENQILNPGSMMPPRAFQTYNNVYIIQRCKRKPRVRVYHLIRGLQMHFRRVDIPEDLTEPDAIEMYILMNKGSLKWVSKKTQ